MRVSKATPARLRGFGAANAITWPDGKRFCFTIFDDTDHATLENVSAVYSFLSDLGMKTTKSVWPLRGRHPPRIGGSTCEDADYLAWVLELKRRGFELALHNVAPCTSDRAQTISGLNRFRELFGHDPACFANHSGCDDNIYWGADRLSGIRASLYRAYSALSRQPESFESFGHVTGSPLFWGDLCKSRIKYVRNFTFRGINTLEQCPYMPYVDPERPLVNYWFASTDGPAVTSFNERISENFQDILEEQGGACIMYTHFASGFVEDGRLDSGFRRLMTRLRQKNGWFVPVGQLLDYLLLVKGAHILTPKERRKLELRWSVDRYLDRHFRGVRWRGGSGGTSASWSGSRSRGR